MSHIRILPLNENQIIKKTVVNRNVDCCFSILIDI